VKRGIYVQVATGMGNLGKKRNMVCFENPQETPRNDLLLRLAQLVRQEKKALAPGMVSCGELTESGYEP